MGISVAELRVGPSQGAPPLTVKRRHVALAGGPTSGGAEAAAEVPILLSTPSQFLTVEP